MKGTFFHRRIMAYLSLAGMFYCAYGVIHLGVTDGAIGGLVVAFGLVIAGYKFTATYDDHSCRKHKND